MVNLLVSNEVVDSVDVELQKVSEKCRVIHVRREVVGDPEYGPMIGELSIHPMLSRALLDYGIERLYSFQYEAYLKIMGGSNVVIVSGTATGKTEAFIIPVIDRVLKEGLRALIIYPTKALARDQLNRFIQFSPPLSYRAAVFDGDTLEGERRRIVESPPHILITNPDMIHFGLAYSSRFRRALQGVKLVVLDEAHVYEGAFGSHMRMIIERLKILLGSGLQFIASSATIGNPEELGKLLFNDDVHVVYGLPRRRGLAYHVLVSSGHLSRWTVTGRLISILSSLGLKVLTFTDSQQMAEVVARIARQNGSNVLVHRAGLLREDRVKVEDAIRSGEIDGVVSTPTLELGVDIGSLDAVVMAAPPPSYVKYLQRAGRAGRRGRVGYVFLVLSDDPIDAYYERKPEEYYAQELTPIVFDPSNDEVIKSHVLAMAIQYFKFSEDQLPSEWRGSLKALVADGYLVKHGGLYRPTIKAWREFERRGLRSACSEIVIVDGRNIIGRRELPAALHDLHPNAIYLHQGRVYKVLELNLNMGIAKVERLGDDWPYYTKPLYEVDVDNVNIKEQSRIDSVPVAYGEGLVTKTVVGYATYHIYSGSDQKPENIEFLDTPVSWAYNTKIMIGRYANYVEPEAIHALEHAIIHAARPVVGAGISDLGGVSYPSGHIVVYDSTPGGSGLAKLLYRRLGKAHRVAYEILSQCGCEDGCPRCVYDPFCGNNNRTLSRRGGLKLIEAVLKGVEVFMDLTPLGKSTAKHAPEDINLSPPP
jgi:DEAD/DEAH box helicase domain-containing protein